MKNRLEEIAEKAQKAIAVSNSTNIPSYNNAIKELAEAIALICIELGTIKKEFYELKNDVSPIIPKG